MLSRARDVLTETPRSMTVLYLPLPTIAVMGCLLGIAGAYRQRRIAPHELTNLVVALPFFMALWIVIAMIFVGRIPEIADKFDRGSHLTWPLSTAARIPDSVMHRRDRVPPRSSARHESRTEPPGPGRPSVLASRPQAPVAIAHGVTK